jgi:hypothetical protein
MYMFNTDILFNVLKNSYTIYCKIKSFVLSVLTEILTPVSNLTWDFLRYFHYKLFNKIKKILVFDNNLS